MDKLKQELSREDEMCDFSKQKGCGQEELWMVVSACLTVLMLTEMWCLNNYEADCHENTNDFFLFRKHRNQDDKFWR